ncbi:MAG: response regulator [Flavipsychrobacter sp.]|nr:response regulator [Flavipsychrobacter sp.]
MNRNIKIMIVEDNPINLKLARVLLEMDGFEVFACMDAESAQESLKEVRPDVILMDVALPEMDGLELTRILKADEKMKDIKIIALTAFAMKTDKDKVMAAGCDGYITKPIDTRKFTEQILELLK